ncbi:hypothetical protein DERF_010713 [Dermatophagoides farinae]|uniref:Uncharacterized protein n=1 Tax=Dermatophagoides farinae TaxID=6954 RepID=A0A922HRD5_DERFA|nr:hypothetical protein DERF_010713 [Dermatophagoides farinae]
MITELINIHLFIGFTFSELKWKRWPHLCKCIILMAIYYYAFRLLDDYQKVAEIKVKQLNQNQFGTLIDFGSEYFFIMAFFSSYLFYFIHGYSLIRFARKLLQQTYNDFKMKKTNEIHSLHTIHTLAIHCDCFHRKISYFLIVNIFRDFIFTFIQLIVLIIHFTLETYWIYLDYDMDRILSKLFIEMHRQRQQQQQCKSTKKQQQLSSFTMNLKQLMIKQSPIDNDNEIIKKIGKYWHSFVYENIRHEIRLLEMSELYNEYFHFNIFNFFRLDQRFMIDLFAFAILNFVLIIQTA